MASTGFWPVKSRLKDVIRYAENPDKATDKRFLDEDLWAALRYVENDQKTDQTMYVSGINCPKQRAYQCMMATKRRYGKLGGNVAYHGYQSFVADEVTPAEAHKIGMETAKRMWGENYEVVVTTHLNTDNIHNHFVVNSVSFKTGRKFGNHIRDHIRLRQISDEICLQHGKSVIPFTHFYSNKKAYWIKKSGRLTHRDILRRDIDEAIASSATVKDFEYCLKNLGYRFERDFYYEHPSVIADGWQRSVRIDSLGKDYTKNRIIERCRENRNGVIMNTIYNAPYKRKPLLILTNPIYCVADEKAYNYFLEQGGNIFGDFSEFDGNHGVSCYNKTDQCKVEDEDSTFFNPKFSQTMSRSLLRNGSYPSVSTRDLFPLANGLKRRNYLPKLPGNITDLTAAPMLCSQALLTVQFAVDG